MTDRKVVRWIVVRPASPGLRLHTRWLTRNGDTTHNRRRASRFKWREIPILLIDGWEAERVMVKAAPSTT